MKRKLLALNLLLVALIAMTGWRLRVNWLQARARQAAFLHRAVQHEAALGQEHPYGLHGIQRDPVRASHDDVGSS